MTDFKFDILYAPKAAQSELDKVMEKYINTEPPYSKGELAEIRKREANILKNEKERKKQEEEEKKRQGQIREKPEEKKSKKVVLGEGETATEKLINADAQKKGGGGLTSEQYDDSAVDYNKLYTNTNPLHNRFRHDANLVKGRSLWELEEEDAIEYLRELYGDDFDFEETNSGFKRRGKAQPKGQYVTNLSFDAIKITTKDGLYSEIIELDLTGFFQEPFGGWDGVKIENYNKLTNFIDTHLTEDGKNKILEDDEIRANVLEQERKENLEPTEEEYLEQISKKELLSTDIFNEKKDITFRSGVGEEISLEFGGYEKDIQQAREELIKENRAKAAASDVAYVDPTIDEIKQRALENLQNEERTYLRQYKYDAYMNELEDFDDWDEELIIKRAKEEFGLEDYEIHLPRGKAFRDKVKKEMKEKYYQLKVAGNTDEAKAVLDYRANELQLKHTVDSLNQNDAWKRLNATNTNIQDLDHKYARHENEVQLDNGKIIPLHIWEQHIRDHAELQPMFNNLDKIRERADASIEVLTDNEFKWDLIARNYNDWERTQEVLGYGFGQLGVTAIYGVPKLLTFGMTGGDDEVIRWKEVVSKNRESFRKDVDWDHAFEDGNFGRFMGQSVVDQIPIYATLATGYAGLGILGGSVFGDKWAEMTMEERATGDFFSTTEKWFKSLGYAASEVVLDYLITVPIMRNAKSMMFSGGGKALLDNTTKSFFRKNAAKSLVFSPALEAISESATQASQNMIDGRPILEGMDHAAFLGLTMGMGISYTGFLGGVVTSQFSDHKSYQTVRDNITEMQKIYNTNANLTQKIINERAQGNDVSALQQEMKDNKVRIDELLDLSLIHI